MSEDFSVPDYFNSNKPTTTNAYTIFPHFCSIPNHSTDLDFEFNFFYNRQQNPSGDGRCDLITMPLKGKTVLDLGCFEGGHTYQFEKKGAICTGIEANTASFLKCLINKNTLHMSSNFLLGDCMEFLQEASIQQKKYDLIWCCGILYHMKNPLKMIELMSTITDTFYIWTLYVPEEEAEAWDPVNIIDQTAPNFSCKGYRYYYPQRYDREYAGSQTFCIRLTQSSIVTYAEKLGFGCDLMTDPNSEEATPGRANFLFKKR